MTPQTPPADTPRRPPRGRRPGQEGSGVGWGGVPVLAPALLTSLEVSSQEPNQPRAKLWYRLPGSEPIPQPTAE